MYPDIFLNGDFFVIFYIYETEGNRLETPTKRVNFSR